MRSTRKIPWMWARLRAMSPAEITWRVRGQVSAALESRRAGNERFQPLLAPRGETLRRVLGHGLSPLIPQPGWRDAMAREFPATRSRLEHRARETMAGRISLYARTVELGTEVNWHRDPVAGITAPHVAAALLDYRDPRVVGNARRIWEINRHHHLAELAQWAWLEEDHRAAAFAVAQLVDWCRQNPPLMGVNWTSSLELAIRTLAWSQIVALLLDLGGPALDDETLALLAGAWIRQVEHIRAHDSRYSSANNHRIGEASAVAAAGLLLPFHPHAEDWWHWGSSVLDRELLLQITRDGVGAEQAFAYQRFVMDFAILVRVLARHSGRDLDPAAIARLGEAAAFLDAVTRPDGSLFAVGDDDEGRAFTHGESFAERALATLECAGRLYDEPGWCRGRFPRARWLGLADCKTSPEGGFMAAPDLTVRGFPEGGYAVVQGGSGEGFFQMLFDAGPLGYGALAAHGHADALSLCLWAGEDLLIDPGTGSYHGDPGWREALRGTDAHNTPCIDGRDQSERRGLFLWGRARAWGRLLASGANDPWFVLAGSHDGYGSIGVPETRRLIAGYPCSASITVLVLDEFLGTGRHRIELPWHLGTGIPEAETTSDGVSFSVRYPGGSRILGKAAVLGGSGSPTIRADRGDEGGSWYAPRFEEREPEGRIVTSVEAELPAALVTAMIVEPGAAGAREVEGAAIQITRCEGGLSCRLAAAPGRTVHSLIAHPLSPEVADERATLRGRLAAWAEEGPSLAPGKAAVAGATAFRCGSLTWKSTDTPITGVLSALAPRAESHSSSTNRTGSDL